MNTVKVKELRLGNWVKDGDSTSFPMYVSVIGDSYLQLEFDGNEGDPWEIEEDEICPIKLNRDILEKVGFNYRGNYTYEYTKDNSILYIAPNTSDKGEKYDEGTIESPKGYLFDGTLIIRCLYVHQLQNMFYSITGKELKIKSSWL